MSQSNTTSTTRAVKNLIIGVLLIVPALVDAQVQCGTIMKSVRLQSDCIAPLIVGNNHVTVDLNGYTVRSRGVEMEEERGGIEVFNKHHVTVKNGNIEGFSAGLWVKGGHHNTFSNVAVRTVRDGGTFALFEDVRNTHLSRLYVRAYEDTSAFRFSGQKSTLSRLTLLNIDGSPLAGVQGDRLTISKSSFGGGFTGTCSPTSLRISHSIVTDNLFTGGAGDPTSGLCLQGDRNRITHNSISSRLGSGLTLVSGKNNLISHNTIVAERENPPTIVDIAGGADACKNRWCNNDFTTDSEGDGPRQGCIR